MSVNHYTKPAKALDIDLVVRYCTRETAHAIEGLLQITYTRVFGYGLQYARKGFTMKEPRRVQYYAIYS